MMSGWEPVVLGLQPINPGPGHATAFSFGAGKTVFKTYTLASAATDDAVVNAPPKPGRGGTDWLIHVPTEQDSSRGSSKAVPNVSGEVVDPSDWKMHWPPVWTIPWPGIVGPQRFMVHRSFGSLEDLQHAVPEISQFAKQVDSLHPDNPRLVLTIPHTGPVDLTQITSVTHALQHAGLHGTILVDHDDNMRG